MGFWEKHWGSPADKERARQWAAEVAMDIRPELTVTRLQALSVNKTTRVLEKVLKKALDYQRSENMGLVRRARLANKLQWELRDRGFSAEFSSLVTEGLVAGAIKSQRPD